MKTKQLTEILERIEAWPPEIQNELAEFALELDAGFKQGEYDRRRKNLPASTVACARRPKAVSPATVRSRPSSPNSAVDESRLHRRKRGKVAPSQTLRHCEER
jgi:hypothetical protein